jgi:manganese/zinc/iron transport system substrate-binding protein
MAETMLFLRKGWCVGLLGLVVAGCAGPPPSRNHDPDVVATTTLVADLARQVSGGVVAVEAIMGPGVDPHLYQAKAADRRKLEQARLVLYHGLHLEGTMTELLEHLPHARAVAAGIPRESLIFDLGQPDPHVWFDVRLWQMALETCCEAMSHSFPQHRETFRRHTELYHQRLEELDADIRRQIDALPPGRRTLITAHDAFRYFGRAYGLRVMGLQGVSTADETGLREINRIVESVLRDRLPAVFAETSVPSDGLEAVIERCRAKGHAVRLAPGRLYSDALDRPDTRCGTYVGMMRFNVETIVQALQE